MTDMKVEILLDMDPGFKAEIDLARAENEKTPAVFDTIVGSLHRTTVAAAMKRKASRDNAPDPVQRLRVNADMSAQFAATAYGVGSATT